MLTADTPEELSDYHEKFKSEADSLEFTFKTYSFGQKKGLGSILPFTQDCINHKHTLQSSSLVNILPFLSRNLSDPEGVFLGMNYYNGSLVVSDLFKSLNANMGIYGVSGVGKTFLAKLLAIRLVLRQTQCIFIDPEGEYSDFTTKLGGEVVPFDLENGFNPFYIGEKPARVEINEHIQTLTHLFDYFIAEENKSSIIDEILVELYNNDKSPCFEDFIKLVKSKKAPFSDDLKKLSKTGSLGGLFSSDRKLKLLGNVICFDISKLKTENIKTPAMYLLSSIIWSQVNKKDKRRMIFIDEAHKLLRNKYSRDFYIDIVRTARKRNCGIVSITQNLEDFDDKDKQAILSNTLTTFLLKQKSNSARYIKQTGIFELTEEEKHSITSLNQGEIILLKDKEHIRLNTAALPSELEIIKETENFGSV
ncbi:MAG: DUF87 domain-containing protein [Thermales bacterium]|nr:DUF87 domain-containing protein [Thermales bacterium]